MAEVHTIHVFYLYRRFGLTLCLSLFFMAGVSGQSVRFSYPHHVSEFDPDFADNFSGLFYMDTFIRSMQNHPTEQIIRILVSGFSSIEGDYALNETLSRDRAEQFYLYLCGRYPALRDCLCDLVWVAEDWSTFSSLVRLSEINEREEILEIVRHIRVFDDREQLLRRLNGGQAYPVLERTFFPSLRRVEVKFERGPLGASSPAASFPDPLVYNVLDNKNPDPRNNRSLAVACMEASHRHVTTVHGGAKSLVRGVSMRDSYRFALKTNLLQWAGLRSDFKPTASLFNVALECFFAGCWSAELGAVYSYWQHDSNRSFQGISGYRIELRRFIPVADNRLDVFLGAYGRVGDYDIRKDRNSFNHTEDYWDAGLSAGLSIPVVSGFYLEVGTRAGYLQTNPIRYVIDGSYNWFDGRGRYSTFKITETGVNLVYRFN